MWQLMAERAGSYEIADGLGGAVAGEEDLGDCRICFGRGGESARGLIDTYEYGSTSSMPFS